MIFADTKAGHLVHILGTALVGQVLTQGLEPVSPHTIELYGHLFIQVVVALVTIWATVRKALQQPETVVKLPVAAVPAVLRDEKTGEAGEGREGGPVRPA